MPSVKKGSRRAHDCFCYNSLATLYCKLQYSAAGEMAMAKTRAAKAAKNGAVSPLMVRLDRESKRYLERAAKLRRLSVSDYVRIVTVAQACREVQAAQGQTIKMTAEEQLSFWNALNRSPQLTESQRRLGAMMRGEA